MKKLTEKAKLETYRKILDVSEKLLLRTINYGATYPYMFFICNELKNVNPDHKICSPEKDEENNMLINYPEIAKQRPEFKRFGDSWWDIQRKDLLIRKSVIENAIAEVLKNNPKLK